MRVGHAMGLWVAVCAASCGDDDGAARDAGGDAARPDAGGTDGGERDAGRCAALACDDGDPCTADRCSEDDGCTHVTEVDEDGDGHAPSACGGDDCDDTDALRHLGNPEVCDVDDRDEDCDPMTFGYRDLDMDDHPDAACCNAEGVERECGDDCDDGLAIVHPGAPEACDTHDNDCDGETNEGVTTTFYRDDDGDMYGVDGDSMEACEGTGAYRAIVAGDCDDAEPARNPGTGEACNFVGDDDCDPTTNPFDEDLDGFDRALCGGNDCNDRRAEVYPGAPDLCEPSSVSNCEEGLPEDLDRDGFMAIGESCAGGSLGAAPRTDCNDRCVDCHPGGTEVCDSVDQDCDPTTLGAPDGDMDGFDSALCCNLDAGGITRCGPDCDDTSSAVRPGATEICNLVDDDCDWMADDGLAGCALRDPEAGRTMCGTVLTCPVPAEHCCYLASRCEPSAVACAASGDIRCDGPEDCGAGQVCCAVYPDGANCTDPGACAGRPTCHDWTDCPTGVGCQQCMLGSLTTGFCGEC